MTYDSMDKHIARHFSFYQTQQKTLEANKTKVALINNRKNWLEKQKIMNYQSEYDRIRSMLGNSNLANKGTPTIEHLKSRKKAVESMGAKDMFEIV
jgi:hypothetical protein